MFKSHVPTINFSLRALLKSLWSSYSVIVILALLLIIQIVQNQLLLQQFRNTTQEIETSLIGTSVNLPRLTTVDGQVYQFPQEATTQQMIIYFHTDCRYCHLDLPLWHKIYAQAAARNINVVAITEETDLRAVATFVTANQIPFPVLLDPERQLLGQLRASVTPTKVLLSSDQRVLQIWRGLTTQQSGDEAIGSMAAILGIDPQTLPTAP